MEKSYKYLGYFMLLFFPLIFIGFYRTYFSLYPEFSNIKTVHHFHGAVAGLWLCLLVAQPFLIQFKKIEWHRIVGKVSYVVFALLVLSFILMIRLHDTLIENFVPTADLVLVVFFYSMAITYRKNSSKHMRYMIASSLVFIDPPVGRLLIHVYGTETFTWFHIVFAIIYTILLILIFYDRAHGKNYKPYLVALAAFFVYQVGFHFVYVY